MVVQGWAWLGRNEVASVLVTIDGVVVGAGELGPASSDVASTRPETRNSSRCSWRAPVDFGPYAGREIVLGAFAITNRGVTQNLTPLRGLVAGRAAGGVDVPASESRVAAGRVRVAGWALPSPGTLARVAVRVNGDDAGSARPLASPRPELAGTRSEAAAPVAGFEHAVVVTGMPGDPVSIEVDVVTCDGRCVTLDPITVVIDDEAPRPDSMPRSATVARSGSNCSSTNGKAAVRLVVFTHRLDVGGGQLYLQDLLRALLPDPDLDCLVVSAADGPLRTELETLGAKICVTTFPVSTLEEYESRVVDLDAIVRAHDANVVLVNTMISGIGADLAARLGIPAVWVIRESFTLDDFWPAAYGEDGVDRQVRGTIERALGRAAALVFEADATRAAYSPVAAAERAVTIAHGVSFAPIDDYLDLDRLAARRIGGFSDTADVVLNVGTMEPRKGQAALVLAFAELADEYPDAALVLVGDTGDTYAAAVHEMTRRLQLGDRIRIEPVTADPRPWYLVADAFVLPSDVESLPRVLLEAMAFGLPVAATAIWGIPEIIDDDKNGLLFEARDLAAIVAVLRRLLSLSTQERQRLGTAAARSVRERHNPTTTVNAIGQLIRGFAEDAAALPRALLAP
jgi:D-inositol-3-phosphate glycosyltransferase